MDLVGCVAGGGEGGEVVADGGGEPGMGLAGGGGGGGEEFDDAADEGEGVGELVAGEVLHGAAVEVVGFGVHGVVRVAADVVVFWGLRFHADEDAGERGDGKEKVEGGGTEGFVMGVDF